MSRETRTGYAIGVALPFIMFLLRQGFGVSFGDHAASLVCILGIIWAGYYGGMKASLLATFLSAGAVGYFLLDRVGVSSSNNSDLPSLTVLLFIGVGAATSWLCEGLHEARRRTQGDKRRLESEIVERKNTERVLRETGVRFRVLLECIQDYAIFALDDRGRVTAWNFGAGSITGYSADEATGRMLSFLYEQENAEEKLAGDLRAADDARWEEQAWCVRKDGSKFWANVILAPLRYGDGRRRGFACVIRDLTPSRQAAQALHDAEARLRLAVQVAGTVVIEIAYNEEGIGVVTGGPDYAALLGLPPGPVELPFVEIQGVFHPQDRVRTLKSIADGMDPTGTGSALMEYRIVRFDGQIRWVSSRAQTFFAPIDGIRRPVKTIAALLDITEHNERAKDRIETIPMTVS